MDGTMNPLSLVLLPALLIAAAQPVQAAAPIRLFDGAGLKGWTVVGNGSWTVQDGEIRARLTPDQPRFTHLVHDTVVKDFRVTFLFRSLKGNAGFFFRLRNVGDNPDDIAGVQVVIDPSLQSPDAFGLYETNGREWLRKWDFERHRNQYPNTGNCMMKADSPKLAVGVGIDENNCRKTLYDPDGWNRISVFASGPRLIVKLNMRTIVDISDPVLDAPGRFAFKLHGGQDVDIRFKDVEISPLPRLPDGLRSKLKKVLLYKGEPGVSPASLREFLKEIASDNGFAMDEGTESDFNAQNLAGYQAALFLSDYNINFNPSQRTAFQDWYKQDHGAACLHACTRQEVSIAWPWWGDVSGSKLADHSAFIERTVALDADAARRPLWKGFDAAPYRWRDEWFFWTETPRAKPGVTVLLSYADDGPPGNKSPKGLPHAWLTERQGGRFFAWGAMHTMNALEFPFTYDFLLHALWDVAGYDTVATALDAPSERWGPSGRSPAFPTWTRTGNALRLHGAAAYTVELSDISGRTLYRGRGGPGEDPGISMDGRAGIVFLKIRSGGRTISRKLVRYPGN